MSRNSFTAPAKPTPLKCVLEKATDWQVQFDINEEGHVKDRNFPPEIAVVTGVLVALCMDRILATWRTIGCVANLVSSVRHASALKLA